MVIAVILSAVVFFTSYWFDGNRVLATTYLATMIAFILLAIADSWDGRVARKFNKITDLGKILDPLADKVMVLPMLLILLTKPRPLTPRYFFWTTIIIVVIETSLMAIALGKHYKLKPLRNLKKGANWMGKTKMVLEIILACLMMLALFFLHLPYSWALTANKITLSFGAALTPVVIGFAISSLVGHLTYKK